VPINRIVSMTLPINPHTLTNEDLIMHLQEFNQIECRTLTLIMIHLLEFDRRRLYANLGHSSLFSYCTHTLGYSDDMAYSRILAARTIARFPLLLDYLKNARLHMTSIITIAPYLTTENYAHLLEQVAGQSQRDVEKLVANLNPQPARREHIRFLGDGRVYIQFTAPEELLDKITRTRGLLRHKFPAGRLTDILYAALTLYLERQDPSRRSPNSRRRTTKPLTDSRYVPQNVKDAVWKRDSGRCVFTTEDGKRCNAWSWLEFDHIIPRALGGKSNHPSNIRLLCRTHNQLMARQTFGEKATRSRAHAR